MKQHPSTHNEAMPIAILLDSWQKGGIRGHLTLIEHRVTSIATDIIGKHSSCT